MKRFNRIAFTVLLMLCSTLLWAQQAQPVEMADTLRRDGKIYTVVIGLVVVLTGFIVFLIVVDKKVEQLGKND
ncbi:MAG: CcmD family protein [Chryseolinea sp.]